MRGEAPDSGHRPADLLPLGLVGRTHGVRGELIFRPYNPQGVSLADLPLPLTTEVRWRSGQVRVVTLVSARPFKDGALVVFEGISSPEEAAQLTNAELAVPRSLLPPLEEGEYYIADLIGCTAVDVAGRIRGVVRGCFWNGTQDILEIADPQAGELLVPAVDDFLLEVDIAGRRIVIDDHES